MLQLKIFLAQTTEHMRDLEIVMPIIFCRFTDLCIPPSPPPPLVHIGLNKNAITCILIKYANEYAQQLT